MKIDQTKNIKYLLKKSKALEKTILESLNDTSTSERGKYTSFRVFANEQRKLVEEASKIIDLSGENISYYSSDRLGHSTDTLWTIQKQVMEATLLYTRQLIEAINKEIEFADDEYSNLENFIRNRLRPSLFDIPEKEKDVQNAIEILFQGRNWSRGIDYDRESGKFEFSGREYIPDFIIPKLELCIEVKLLKDKSRRSKIIEEINADVTAYNKAYKRQMYIVYDVGCIQNEYEFKSDIEKSKENVKVIVVKH